MADEAARLKRKFKAHTDYVKTFLRSLDHVMKESSSEERGKKIAELAGGLEMANDAARRFALNLDFNGKPLNRQPLKQLR